MDMSIGVDSDAVWPIYRQHLQLMFRMDRLNIFGLWLCLGIGMSLNQSLASAGELKISKCDCQGGAHAEFNSILDVFIACQPFGSSQSSDQSLKQILRLS